jgi:hypothetical protein
VRFAVAVVLAIFIAAQGDALGKSRKRAKKKPKPTPAASSRADGKDHLKKAKALAAKDACELAIEEFTLAFDRLNDPDILLLRAECRRKVGQDADAVADYNAYLEVTPDVRNRVDIEAKIAALESGTDKTPTPSEKPPAPPPVVEHKPPPPPAVAERKPPPPPPTTAPPPPPPPVTIEPPPSPPPVVTEVPIVPGAPPATPVTSEPEPARSPAADPEAKPGGSKGHFWLWTIVAVVVAGGAAAAGYWYLRPADEPPPVTQLGNFRF